MYRPIVVCHIDTTPQAAGPGAECYHHYPFLVLVAVVYVAPGSHVLYEQTRMGKPVSLNQSISKSVNQLIRNNSHAH